VILKDSHAEDTNTIVKKASDIVKITAVAMVEIKICEEGSLKKCEGEAEIFEYRHCLRHFLGVQPHLPRAQIFLSFSAHHWCVKAPAADAFHC
jgi:hypothetical protein